MISLKVAIFPQCLRIIALAIVFILFSCKSLDFIIAGAEGRDVVQMSLLDGDTVDLSSLDKMQLKGFSIGDYNNPIVKKYIQGYQTYSRDAFTRVLERSRYYVPEIKKTLREKGVPEELAYLPIIESSFIPTAKSPANAMGLWQFMYHTGRIYKLESTYWHDDRLDAKRSTEAAAYHLKYLYKKFDNWLLVLAAYNAGGGKISRLLAKQPGADFWALCDDKELKKETREYVPKFIAACMIAKNPEAYGFPDPDKGHEKHMKEYTIEDSTDIELLAVSAGMKVSDFRFLNPSLLQWATPPSTPFNIYIPEENYPKFQSNFAAIPTSERVTFRRYTVKIGDNLTRISKQFNIPVNPIVEINKFKSKNAIQAGVAIIIPIKGLDHAKELDKQKAQLSSSEIPSGGRNDYVFFYTVKQAETVYEIARKYGVEIASILTWNGLESYLHVRPGKLLMIKTPR